MAREIRRLAAFIWNHWERALFGVVGLVCLALCFRYLVVNNITSGAALFGMSFFSFFYSNLARFKKFKGLGFEAELWEDKQKEAADLIDRLKSIVTVYTREIVMNNVMRNRFSSGKEWQRRWAVYDELTGKHAELGQKIDFAPLKREVDRVFVFDICSPLSSSLRRKIEKARGKASEKITSKYSSIVSDIEGHNAEHAKLSDINSKIDDLFEKADTEDIAQSILDLAEDSKSKLIKWFDIDPEYDDFVIDRLRKMSLLIKEGPIVVTPELIDWAHWQDSI